MNDTELFFWLARAMGGVAAVDFGAVLPTEIGKKWPPTIYSYDQPRERARASLLCGKFTRSRRQSYYPGAPFGQRPFTDLSGLQGIAPSDNIIYPWGIIPSKELHTW